MNSFIENFSKQLFVLGLVVSSLACVSHAEGVTTRELAEVADLSGPVVSPDGHQVAFRLERAVIERNTFDTTWYVQDVDGASPPHRVGDGGFAVHDVYGLSVPAKAVWSADGRWIYYLAMIDGKMDVWRAASDGSRAEPVTLDPADVRDFSLGDDGHSLNYSVGATREQVSEAEQAEYNKGVRLDESVPVGQPLFRSSYIDGRLATQRLRDNELTRVPLLSAVPDRWKTLDLVTGERRDLALSEVPRGKGVKSDVPETASAPWMSAADPHGDRVARLTRVGPDEGVIQKPYSELSVQVTGKTGSLLRCQADTCRNKAITSIQWRPNSDDVVFTVTDPDEGDAQSIAAWDTSANAVREIVHLHGLLNGGRDVGSTCGVSRSTLVCVAAEADKPPRLEAIDLESGRRHVLFEPNAALAAEIAATTPARFLRWKDARGQTFTGQFFAARRIDNRAPPLFVNYYRCTGFLRGGTGDEWPLATLADQGISALCINYAPIRVDAAERYNLGLLAVRSVVDLLASEGEIDRSRVGMGGLSHGAEVTLWTAMNSNLLTAASMSSPMTSPLFYQLLGLYGDSFYPRMKKFWQLGSPSETPQRWKTMSPMFNLEKIKVPVLMQLPEQEYLFSLDYVIPLLKKDRAELYVFPDEPHFKFLPKHKLAAYERNLDWFEFWLRGYEDSNPVKKQQYVHWRVMRDAVSAKSARSSTRSGS